jgi:hypothetical protein
MLTVVGYWDGPETDHSWPSPETLVDETWDAEERELVAAYLSTGLVAQSYMGYSRCRFCGRQNGNLDLSDGVFVWPEGLSHYVSDHSVRLPERFVTHPLNTTDELENAHRDLDWWRSLRSAEDGSS